MDRTWCHDVKCVKPDLEKYCFPSYVDLMGKEVMELQGNSKIDAAKHWRW